jgi:hypothetical protein
MDNFVSNPQIKGIVLFHRERIDHSPCHFKRPHNAYPGHLQAGLHADGILLDHLHAVAGSSDLIDQGIGSLIKELSLSRSAFTFIGPPLDCS